MKVPLLDLNQQHQKLQNELLKNIQQVLAHGKFILGPEVEIFENAVAKLCEAQYAISCANGSDALLLALMALDIGAGDEVITTPYSFFATASCIARVGAKAIFADISLTDYNIDPLEVLKKISPRTKAIIPVHLFGQSAEMTPYLSVAKARGIRIIEDAAQAIGTTYQGRAVGALGDIGTLSFFPTKNLGGLGDGGMLLTNDQALARKIRFLRVHGSEQKYYHTMVGINSRLDTIQAAVLNTKLVHLNGWKKKRQEHASFYIKHLVESGLASAPTRESIASSSKPLILPLTCQLGHVFNQFIIRTQNPLARDPLRKHLESAGIGTEIYYPVPLHLQKCFSQWNYHMGDFPNSELASQSTLALPVFPELSENQMQYVIEIIHTFNWKI